jgi:uncharacterized membrane protein
MATVTETIDIAVPVRTAYNQWTQFEQFPDFMEGISDVRQLDDVHLHWVAELGGKLEEWDAEITEQRPDECVAWRSTSGKLNAGVVRFAPLGPESTRLTVEMEHDPEGVIETVGSAVGADQRRVRRDLEQFRAMIEERGHETGGWRGEVAGGSPTGRSATDGPAPGMD